MSVREVIEQNRRLVLLNMDGVRHFLGIRRPSAQHTESRVHLKR